MTLAEELDAAAHYRWVRWNSAQWRELVDGPAAVLANQLHQANFPVESASRLLEAYLRLGAEALGRGYLIPNESGAGNFFTHAWSTLLPEVLSLSGPQQAAQHLADCWNLAENLESSPAWLQRIFLKSARQLRHLEQLPGLVSEVSALVLEAPAHTLESHPPQLHLIPLDREDRLFLPGEIRFVSPTVICVFDRLRSTAERPVTQGIWLSNPPLPLGPLGDPGDGQPSTTPRKLPKDHRITTLFRSSANPFRAAASMVTSQCVAVWIPENQG